MYTISKEFEFHAAHFLPLHDGKCRSPHGHSYKAIIICKSPSLIEDGPKTGMVQDYYDISQAVKPIIEQYLDHHDINETTGLQPTTSENLSKWLFDKLQPSLPFLAAVIIKETESSSCKYEPEL